MFKKYQILVFSGLFFAIISCSDDDEGGGAVPPMPDQLLPRQTLADNDQTLTRYSVNDDTETFVADHVVDTTIVSFREDKALHARMFDRLTGLVPTNRRNFIKQYTPFHGADEIAGYVYPLREDRSEWNFGLDVLVMEAEEANIANANPGDQVSIPASATVLHEYGHLLSLFQDQLDLETANCTNFDSVYGCMRDGTKLQVFFENFWESDYAEFLELRDQVGEDEVGDQWFQMDETRFVSAYAATQPEEDFAESFYIFFFRERPDGTTVEDQKVEFFYDFPDLVTLRDEVRDYLINTVLAGTPPPPSGGRLGGLVFEAGLPTQGRTCALGHNE